MKRINLTEILDEILGVPEGIVETAKTLYEGIVEDLKKQHNKYSDLTTRTQVTINGPFNISDYTFNKAEIYIEIKPIDDNVIDWAGMAFGFNADLEKPYKKYTYGTERGTISLMITLLANPDIHRWGDIINYLSGTEKASLMSSLAHELKHAYDRFKSKSEPASSIIKYKTTTDVLGAVKGAPGIGQFLFLLYYTTLTENLVRATEVGSYLKYKETTQKEFLNILRETQVYKHIKEAQALTYEGMIDDMLANPRMASEIKDIFDNEDLSGLSDVDLVKKFLRFVFIQFKSRAEQNYAMAVKNQNPMMVLFSQFGFSSNEVDEEKEKAIADFKKEVNKYSDDDYEKFYRNEIAQIHFNADKIIRKLAKLYAYI